jgi:hypothetical protein
MWTSKSTHSSISVQPLFSHLGSCGQRDRGQWWPVLIVLRRASMSAASLLLSFVSLFLSSLRYNPISLCGIFCCLFHVDLARSPFLSFYCSPEAWGGTLLQLSPSFLKTSFVTSSRWRDLHISCGCSVGSGFGAYSRFKPFLATLSVT